MGDHLSYIFPLPWDTEGNYRVGNVELYIETGWGPEAEAGAGGSRRTGLAPGTGTGTGIAAGRGKAALIKVGRKMTLLEVLGGGKVVVWDGLVRVNVLLKGKAAGWIEEVKKRKGVMS